MLVNLSLAIRYGPSLRSGPNLMVLVKGLPTYTYVGKPYTRHSIWSLASLITKSHGARERFTNLYVVTRVNRYLRFDDRWDVGHVYTHLQKIYSSRKTVVLKLCFDH